MANLNENTQYNNTGNSLKTSDITNLISSIQEKMKNGSVETFSNSNSDKLFGIPTSKKNSYREELINIPASKAGVPLKTQSTDRFSELPEDYFQTLPKEEGKWGEKTDTTKLRNWPSDLGGGQYLIDQNQPGEMIKSYRALMDSTINPGAKQKVLGNLSPKLFEVDHNIPIWAGGGDTLENLQILDRPTHDKKTAIQNVPYVLWENGKMSLNEARALAASWKDKDTKGVPSKKEIDEYYTKINYLDSEIKKFPYGSEDRIKLENQKKEINTNYVVKFEKVAQKWKDDIANPKITWSNFKQSFKEEMGKFGEGWMPDVVREGLKGFVGGVSANAIPGTGASEDSSKAAKVSNVIGNIGGSIFGLGKFTKGASLLFAGKEAMAAKKAATLAEDSMKAVGILDADLGAANIAKEITKKTISNKTLEMIKMGGLLGTWNLLGTTGQDILSNDEVTFKDYLNHFFDGVVYGGLTGGFNHSISGFAGVGLGTLSANLITSSMRGEDPDIVSAVKDAAIMTALHGIGYKKGSNLTKQNIASEEAYKMSANTFNNYVGDLVPLVSKKYGVPPQLKLDLPKVEQARIEYKNKYPNEPLFNKKITNDKEALDFMEKVGQKKIGDLASGENGYIPSEQEIEREMTRLVVAKNQLFNQTLPKEERAKKELADLISLGNQLKPQLNSDMSKIMTSSQKLNKLDLNKLESLENIPYEIKTKYDGVQFAEGKTGARGVGRGKETEVVLNPEARTNLNAMDGKHDGNAYIVLNDKSKMMGDFINTNSIMKGKDAPILNPENTSGIYLRDSTTGEFKWVGYTPQEQGRNIANQFNINKPYYDMVNKIKSIIDRAQTPEDIMNGLNKEKAFRKDKIDINKANDIFNKKDIFKTMTDDEVVAASKASDPLVEYNLDNSILTPEMKKNGIDILVGKVSKLSPENVGENIMDPSIEISISRDDWIRSLLLKGQEAPQKSSIVSGATQEQSPVGQKTIDIMNRIYTPKKEITPEETKSSVIFDLSKKPEPIQRTQVLPFEEPVKKVQNAINNRPAIKEQKTVKKESNAVTNTPPERRTSPVVTRKTEKGIEIAPQIKKPQILAQNASNTQNKSSAVNSVINAIKAVYKEKKAPHLKDENRRILTKQNISGKANQTPAKMSEEFYNDIMARVDYTKAPASSPEMHQKALNKIIDAFKRENPGMSKTDFDYAINTAKTRAKANVEEMINDLYGKSEVFGKDGLKWKNLRDTQKEQNSGAKNPLVRRYNQLKRRSEGPNEYIEVKNDMGEIERHGKTQFEKDVEKEYLTPLTKKENKELSVLRKKITKHANNDSKINEIKNKAKSENRSLSIDESKEVSKLKKENFNMIQDYLGPKEEALVIGNKFGLKVKAPENEGGFYSLVFNKKGNPEFTEEFKKKLTNKDTTPSEYWGKFLDDELAVYKDKKIKDTKEWQESLDVSKNSNNTYMKNLAKTIDAGLKIKYGDKWGSNWSANAAIKKSKNNWFSSFNQEGYSISEPYRRTAAIISGGDRYSKVKKAVSDADKITKNLTEEAKNTRLEKYGKEEYEKPSYADRIKDDIQTVNVSEDLTPIDAMMTALLSRNARENVLRDYNTLVDVLANTHKKDEVMEELKESFELLKKLSPDIPLKRKYKWNLGEKIVIKNTKPTAEEGARDGVRILGSIFKYDFSQGNNAHIDFDRLRKAVLEMDDKNYTSDDIQRMIRNIRLEPAKKGGPNSSLKALVDKVKNEPN
jgi:hypothetical protein